MGVKNELDRFKKIYVYNRLNANGAFNIFSRSQKPNFDKLMEAFMRSENFDRPDGYWFDDESSSLYIFEHFEFDCSSNNRNGSKLRKNIAAVDREIKEEMSNTEADYNSVKPIEQGIGVKKGNTIIYNVGANGDIYRNNYIANFQRSYESHSKKLREYIENCEQALGIKSKKVVTTFLIEDITLGGTYYKNSDGMGEPVDLISTKQFLESFKNSSIDYIIFGRLQEQVLIVCDRTVIEDKSIQYVDLYEKELYIFPAMPQITVSRKIKNG